MLLFNIEYVNSTLVLISKFIGFRTDIGCSWEHLDSYLQMKFSGEGYRTRVFLIKKLRYSGYRIIFIFSVGILNESLFQGRAQAVDL